MQYNFVDYLCVISSVFNSKYYFVVLLQFCSVIFIYVKILTVLLDEVQYHHLDIVVP